MSFVWNSNIMWKSSVISMSRVRKDVLCSGVSACAWTVLKTDIKYQVVGFDNQFL